MKPARSITVILIAGAAGIVGVDVGSRRAGTLAKHDDYAPFHPPHKEVEPESPVSKTARTADAEPEVPRFVGYLTSGSEQWFALSLPAVDASKERQELLTVGQKIGDFEICGFDPQKEMLSLRVSGGKYFEVAVADASTAESTEQLKRRWRHLFDLSPRAIRDIYPPVVAPSR